MWCLRQDRNQNEVVVIMDERILKDVNEVCRMNDMIIKVKIVCAKEILDIISTYAPQVRIEESIKINFLEDLDDMVQNIPMNEKFYIKGGFRHVEVWHFMKTFNDVLAMELGIRKEDPFCIS